jgi:hypothetical protein
MDMLPVLPRLGSKGMTVANTLITVQQKYICPFIEEVTESAHHEVLMEVDGNISLIVGNPQGILGESSGLAQSTHKILILY